MMATQRIVVARICGGSDWLTHMPVQPRADAMALTLMEPGRLASDPLDAVERVMMASRLSFERMGDEDITGSFGGGWCNYQLWFAYRADLDVLHFASGFDMRVPAPRRRAVDGLVSLINESLWIGHFDLWAEEGQPTWRHALLLRGTPGVEEPQIVDLVTLGVGECERFYPAFEQVVGAGLAPEAAFEAALMEPRGHA